MLPKFKNLLEYQKAEILLQPIYLRLIDNIRQESELLEWNVSYEEITEPFTGYNVLLKKGNYSTKYNLWELCFKICFNRYEKGQITLVETDKTLIDDNGELDWQQIEIKTKKLVKSLLTMSTINN